MKCLKIAKKYCTSDKVQVMFSNARSQIICSKDGYLYLRDGDVILHRYLEDDTRGLMPFSSYPSSSRHTSHLLKYNQTYIKFTSSRPMGSVFAICDGGYELTFLYATKAITGEVILAEWSVFDGEDFYQKPTEITKYMTRKQLEEFLYGTSGLIGKYIFSFNDFSGGIKYAWSANEEHFVKKNFIDLPDEVEDVSKVEHVKEFCITGSGFVEPAMVTITDSEVTLYVFSITYCSKDHYKVELQKVKVKPNKHEIRSLISKAKYPPEPTF